VIAEMSKWPTELPDVPYWTGRIPCQMACPVKTDCGRYVQLIAAGRDRDAYLTARSPNPLASVCGRICAAPCESQCRRGHFGAPVAIRALKRFVTERFGVESLEPSTSRELFEPTAEPGNRWRWHLSRLESELEGVGEGGKVAVVGAGPAGLACAHDLAVMGYRVTVFEGSGRAGGMAFHGIPEFRLPRGVLDKEIQSIAELGVEFRFNTPLTTSHGLAQLRAAGFLAVFLCVGAQRARDLAVPGAHLDGIVRAVDYLLNINNGFRVPKAERVLVVGGGFVAFDAARMALRAAAASVEEAGGGMNAALDAARLAVRTGAAVTLASLESYHEMPVTRTEQGQEEFAQAIEEGITFMPQRGVASFEADPEAADRVARTNLIGVTRTYDEEGRFAPVYDETVTEVCQADLVILAIGQQPDLGFLTPEDGIELTPARTLKVDPRTLATTSGWVFAGGDAAFGPRNLIDAVADGKRAARGIHELLARGDAGEPRFRFRFVKIPSRLYDRTSAYDLLPRTAPPTSDLGRRSGVSEVETGYDAAEARRQAERCLTCHVQTIYDAEKCVLCNRCVDICPESCLKLVPFEDLDLPLAHGIAARTAGKADGGIASAMIKDDEVCIRCGLCAIRCPTDAMTMEVLSYEEE